jgi:transglutaminase-like putative cysteine protease
MTWRLRIRHVTGYTYAGAAKTSYNEARLTPMTLPWQTTLFSHVDVEPHASTWRYYDYWTTLVTAFDLREPHSELKVTASSLVETDAPAPPADTLDWPQLRAERIGDRFAEMLVNRRLTAIDGELAGTASEAVNGPPPAGTAAAIARWVRANVEYVPGSTGVQTSAQEAWSLRKGVCQDIAHLTVGLLRNLGIPARYVSGYLHPQPKARVGEVVVGQSHAWVEWWCGDWVGYDPTNGIPVGERHVVVARGRDYADVPPLKGIYHGPPSTDLGVTVEITRLA